MSIISVKRIPSPSASNSLSEGLKENQLYRVKTSSVADSIFDAMNASVGGVTVPQIQVAHDLYPAIRCLSVDARRLEFPRLLVIDVSCSFGVPPQTQWEQIPPAADTTTKWATTVVVRGAEVSEPVYKDSPGKPLQNTAYQRFPDGQNKIYYDEELTIRFNCRRVNGALVQFARGLVNSDTVVLNLLRYGYTRMFPPNTLKLGNITYQTASDPNGDPYFQVDMPLLYRTVLARAKGDTSVTEHGWQRLIIDQGYHKLSGGKPIRILEKNASGTDIPGVYKSTPSFLDGEGGVLAAGDDCVLIPFTIDDRFPFAPLLIGIS